MTFIATVIAKKGAVLIADSLVTTSRQVLEFEDFYTYLKSKNGTSAYCNSDGGRSRDERQKHGGNNPKCQKISDKKRR